MFILGLVDGIHMILMTDGHGASLRSFMNQGGLTLVEILMVIGIIAVLASMSLSSLGNFAPSYGLKSAARELYANMHRAQREAIKQNQKCRIIFDMSHSRYAISLEAGADNDWSTIADNQNILIVQLDEYKGNIHYGRGHFSGSDPITYVDENIIFYSDGKCGPLNGYVYLENNDGKGIKIGSMS